MLLEDHVIDLVKQFAENQIGGDDVAFEAAFDSLLEIGSPVIGLLAEIVADTGSSYRIAAIDLLECFHGPLDSSAALPALRNAMVERDPWLKLVAAEAIWIVDGESPRDIAADALGVISEAAALKCESPHSELAQVRRRAKGTLKILDEIGMTM